MITTRQGKGSPLTHDEVDSNFIELKNAQKIVYQGLDIDVVDVETKNYSINVGYSMNDHDMLIEVLVNGVLLRHIINYTLNSSNNNITIFLLENIELDINDWIKIKVIVSI